MDFFGLKLALTIIKIQFTFIIVASGCLCFVMYTIIVCLLYVHSHVIVHVRFCILKTCFDKLTG